MEHSLTQGSLAKAMLRFSIPFLISSFLQTFYGLADLFITGQFNGADQVTAVSIGSQVTHMFTVVTVGLAMGTTVSISHVIGAGRKKNAAAIVGNSITVFAIYAASTTAILLLTLRYILQILQTPAEALEPTKEYLLICFAGIPFIVAYNVISSIYRGMGDTTSPMIFVGVAGVVNIALDYILIGPFHMGAFGAAIATVSAQAFSVLFALIFARKMLRNIGLSRGDFRLQRVVSRKLLAIGVPISCQDGFIQISFLVITMIANSRGLEIAAAVGIVEKIISFLFLVPSAMLSTVSAVTAQNAGAGLHDRGRQTLKYGILICIGFGVLVSLVCQFASPLIVGLFVKNEPQVVIFGGQYLRSYSFDCFLAGVHFCFSGYFSAYGKSIYSFVHNVISVLAVRIPGTYLAAVLFPATLFPMGLAAPAGSFLSILICLGFYHCMKKQTDTLLA